MECIHSGFHPAQKSVLNDTALQSIIPVIPVFNPIALRMAKTLWSFGCSKCNRVMYCRISHTELPEYVYIYHIRKHIIYCCLHIYI